MKSDNPHMFQYLTEIVEKGFPLPTHTESVIIGDFVWVQSYSISAIKNSTYVASGQESVKVGFFFDGPIYPIRNGACYTLTNLMRALKESNKVNPILICCYRGWDSIEEYFNRAFSSALINPVDYYEETGLLEDIILKVGIEIAQFYDTELLVKIGPRLKKIGVKLVLEVQNINHILLKRLGVPKFDIEQAIDYEKQAFSLADRILCRSQVDLDQAIEQGAQKNKSKIYRGGIFVEDFQFSPIRGKYKLLFLGHMYYQPNENAFNAILRHILPKLDDRYSLTIIGIAPKEMIEKHTSERIKFKGGIDNLSEELLNYDIALAPIIEGSGTRLKVLDYMASGMPIIATDIAGFGVSAYKSINIMLPIDDCYFLL